MTEVTRCAAGEREETERGPGMAGREEAGTGEPMSMMKYDARHLAIRLIAIAALALAALGLARPLSAQNLFAPVARVNDEVVTAYELSQRMAFFKLLRAQGDIRKAALDQLINERLQKQAAKLQGVTITEDQLRAGMEEFAARGNLTAEEFLKAIQQAGLAAETFRDFIGAGVLWRETVRARFQGKITISDKDLDDALTEADPGEGKRYLLAEIVLPASTDQSRKASLARANRLREINDIDAFSAAARRFSISSTRAQGGALEWAAPEGIPAEVVAQLRRMKPGQVTRPLVREKSVVIYQLREEKTLTRLVGDVYNVDYAAYFIPGGRSEAALATAARVKAGIDTCDDLYGVAKGQPEEQLVRETKPENELPRAYAAELAKLDENEVSTALTARDGTALVFLMLCDRSKAILDDSARKRLLQALQNQRLNALAVEYLQELKAAADIEIIGG